MNSNQDQSSNLLEIFSSETSKIDKMIPNEVLTLVTETKKTRKKKFIVTQVLQDLPSALYKSISTTDLSKSFLAISNQNINVHPDYNRISSDDTEGQDTIVSLKDATFKKQLEKIKLNSSLKASKYVPPSLNLEPKYSSKISPKKTKDKTPTPISKREFSFDIRRSVTSISSKNQANKGFKNSKNVLNSLYDGENSEIFIEKCIHEIKINNEEAKTEDEIIDPEFLRETVRKIIARDKKSEKRKKCIIISLFKLLTFLLLNIIFLMGGVVIFSLITRMKQMQIIEINRETNANSTIRNFY